MPDQTTPERIIALFEHLWPSEAFRIRSDAGTHTVSFVISSKDLLTTYARVRFEPKSWTEPKGYNIEIAYPAFNGTLDEMTGAYTVITYVAEVVKKMQQTALIKGGA